LLELLVVVAIIAIVGSLAVSGLGVWSGRGVTNAGNLLLENISFSRELAVSLDRPVEIWFLRAQGTTPVTAFQIYTIDDNGNAAPYSEVYHIPTGAIIDSGNSSSAQNLSPLIAAATVRQWAGAQAKPSIGTFGSNYDCWYVRFMPDSSTTLAPSQQWYLTVHAQTLGDPLPSLPANYAVVSIEPFTGHVALYRP
jgi:uncharacterized protein (TIGR02596 family)